MSCRYIVATQDKELQQKCRQIVGVPLLYLHSRMPTLEGASVVTQSIISNKSVDNFSLQEFEKKKLYKLSLEIDGSGEPMKKLKKRKGGPNPLSCKKKKVRPDELFNNQNSNKTKRKRNRNRLLKKIKAELIGSTCSS
ncbi:hypothetical protein RUM44_002359 [Polyplax serrata]|uniref:UTP23 sensor motif region domain-containing protein n=1 Tax=Polyplax serrata TaxID=468196 RepID=A0ABR1AMM5_POLSC